MTAIHVQSELAGDKGFKKAMEVVNSLHPKPEFVIMGGDLIMDALQQNYARVDSLYTMYSEICKNFTMPVYHGIGNRAQFGVFEKSGIQPDHPDYAKEMFKTIGGSFNFSFIKSQGLAFHFVG